MDEVGVLCYCLVVWESIKGGVHVHFFVTKFISLSLAVLIIIDEQGVESHFFLPLIN